MAGTVVGVGEAGGGAFQGFYSSCLMRRVRQDLFTGCEMRGDIIQEIPKHGLAAGCRVVQEGKRGHFKGCGSLGVVSLSRHWFVEITFKR